MRGLTEHSKRLSWLLRHGAHEAGLPMDEAGWAPIEAVLRIARLRRPELDAVVRENNKQRLQVRDEHIRACQGHSTEGTPVRPEALEASWTPWAGESSLWHGTTLGALPAIAREGLLPRARTHVHLAAAPNSHVGKRAQVDLLLEIDPARVRAAGQVLFEAENGVVLCRAVPPASFTGLRPCTAAARTRAAELEQLLGLPSR